MTKKYIRIAELIYKDKIGEITEQEKNELLSWLNETDFNRQIFDELSKGSSLSHSYEEYRAIHREQVWRLIEKQVVSENCGLSWRWIGYAASVVVLIVAGWFIFQTQSNEESSWEGKEVAAIIPGTQKAILHLDNGKQIVLADHDAVLVEDRLSGRIEQVNRTLVYQAETNVSEERFNTLEIPRGGEFQITLADGTRVWLNAESKLTYPVAFVGEERHVSLEGEGYFVVTRDSLHPFVVETRGQVLTVLGTSFGIRAYEDEIEILTTLEHGRVRVVSAGGEIELAPGYQSRLTDGVLVVNKVNTSLYTAWHKGIFVFEDQALKEILNTLSRWYNIDVSYETIDLEAIRFTGELRRYNDIREFLERIQELGKVRFDIKNRTVIVSKY
ncbi:FecR family protein [Butyricimonas paravirosa]